jgi:hypothetical protein
VRRRPGKRFGAYPEPVLAALADRNDAEFFGCLTAGERKTLGRLLKSVAERGHMIAIPIE